MPAPKWSLILDFDSTIVQAEALDTVALISLPAGPTRDEVITRVAQITTDGMEGRISISDSLANRLKLLRIHRDHLNPLVSLLKQRISPSFLRCRDFLASHSENIFVITSGFEEYVVPVCADLSIRSTHIFANRFIFDSSGYVLGFDNSRLPSRAQGKSAQLCALRPQGTVIAAGDGITDLEMKHSGIISTFVAYVETVHRDAVVKGADRVAASFEDIVAYINSL